MDDNLSNIQLSENKKTIIPLILGIVSIFLPLFWIIEEVMLGMDILGTLDSYFSKNFPILGAIMGATIFIVPGILSAAGIIFGIINFVLTKKQGLPSKALTLFFIFGLALCIIGLLIWLFELWLVNGIANI